MTTLIVSRHRWMERLLAAFVPGRTVTRGQLADAATEESLAQFPPEFWNESQEANLFVVNRLKDARWRSAIARVSAREQIDAERLERRMIQSFVLTLGRRLAMLRLCPGAVGAAPIRLLSDLPVDLLRAFEPEIQGRMVPSHSASWPLRAVSAAQDLGWLLARHPLAIVRMLKLQRLPVAPATRAPYVAWLHALPAEVKHHGREKASLTEFLSEGRGDRRCEIVIQGAPPSTMPEGVSSRQASPALRYRPRWRDTVRGIAAQMGRAFDDLRHAADFRHRMLIAPAVFDLPAFRLWFRADRPDAVLYPNHVIGNEPPVALAGPGAPLSMMVFYSANVSYRPAPRVERPAGEPTALEPEIRFIIADRLTMWSPEMTATFAGAGFARSRLVETGPIVFARARGFHPDSKGAGSRAVRIGLFEVTPVRPSMRVEQGYGQLLYTPEYARRFFADIADAARAQFGRDAFVFVRKIKRAPGPHNVADPDLAHLGVPVVTRDPDDSLWRVLEGVDLVLCMPFTSVAYVADCHGIPAAYYDPGATAEPSPLGGRAALLRGPEALRAWFAVAGPGRPGLPVPEAAAARVFDAVLSAAASAARSYDAAMRLERNVIHT